MPAVVLSDVRVSFEAHEVLVGANLRIRPGALTVITGANGVGKSTLLEVIAGTIKPSVGSRVVLGDVAFVPQRAAVSPRLPVSVNDVVSVGTFRRLGMWKRRTARSIATVRESLRRLGIADLAHKPFGELSGGQQQRALLAQGLAGEADILLVDEPTTGLDSESAQLILAALRDEAARGRTVVCVSHDDDVIQAADEVVAVADGRTFPHREEGVKASGPMLMKGE